MGSRRLGPSAVVVMLILAGCATRAEPASGDRLRIVTTVAPITSIVASVAGDAADVTGVVPEGVNSHTFEPAPSVAQVVLDADLIFLNGLHLEDPTLRLVQRNKADHSRIVALGDQVLAPSEYIFDFSFPKSGGKPNPHLWTDPGYARQYAAVVRDTLVALDGVNADVYRRNYATFAERVDELDAALLAASASMAREQRKLLTYHDAYAYFARRYEWTIIGAIQVSSFDDPSPREVAELIKQVKAERVPAIFGSELFPSPVLAQIGKETGVKYLDVLRDDDLPGQPGEPEHSWLGLMRFDFVTMVEALGGDASALRALEIGGADPDRARYPQ